jgi:hypothetical protein
MMKKAIVPALVLCLLCCAAAAFGQAMEDSSLASAVFYPYVRVMGDIGFTYDMSGVQTTGTSFEDGRVVTDTEFNLLYNFAGPGIGGVVQGGVDFEILGLWQGKGMVGMGAFAMGGYLDSGDSSQFLAGGGLDWTLGWVGKFIVEIGYTGFLSPIAVPTDYTGTYTYSDQEAGGFFLGLDMGLEVPLFIVPNLYVFACYKYFTVYVTGPVSPMDPNDQGYWLSRNSVCVGLSYAIGPGTAVNLD